MKKQWIIALAAAVTLVAAGSAYLLLKPKTPASPTAETLPQKALVPNGTPENAVNALETDANEEKVDSDDSATESSYTNVDKAESSVGDSYNENDF